MTTLDDPMSLDEALRIIRNVVEHNTQQIPSANQIVEAMATSLIVSLRATGEIDRLAKTMEKASALMAEASTCLQDAWNIVMDWEQSGLGGGE